MKFKWECPRCGSGVIECAGYPDNICSGLLCECDEDPDGRETHGVSLFDRCLEANCYHCGWSGVMPPPPKGLQAWEKKALEAGWTPPTARAKEIAKR